jgi:gas vesicle protein
MEGKMSRVTNFLFGLILGGLVGSATALLFTPASGENLRTHIRGYVTNVEEEVRKAAEAKRVELETKLAALRGPRPTPPA